MFDPGLWKATKATTISLVVLGALLVIPSGFVFLLAGSMLLNGSIDLVFTEEEGAVLFFSAVGASAVGTTAWASLVFLLAFQRHNIRAHLLTWPLVAIAGAACLAGVLVWIGTIGPQVIASLPGFVLMAVFTLSPILVALGIRNFQRARRAHQARAQSDYG